MDEPRFFGGGGTRGGRQRWIDAFASAQQVSLGADAKRLFHHRVFFKDRSADGCFVAVGHGRVVFARFERDPPQLEQCDARERMIVLTSHEQ